MSECQDLPILFKTLPCTPSSPKFQSHISYHYARLHVANLQPKATSKHLYCRYARLHVANLQPKARANHEQLQVCPAQSPLPHPSISRLESRTCELTYWVPVELFWQIMVTDHCCLCHLLSWD